ncbi:MAG: hypothetical protein AAF267_14840 [Deinococcota bacterium]
MELPTAFCDRMTQTLADADTFFAALSQAPVTSLRVNPQKLSGEAIPLIPRALQVDTQPVPWHPDGIYLASRPQFVADPLFHAGAYYVQEASSMVLYQLLADMSETASLRILDMCAAPGGKSTLLAAAMPAGSLLVSNEVVPARASILTENMRRWGHPQVLVISRAADNFARLEGFFDVVLVDAPCSGEGMFRKDETSVSQWSQDLIDTCAVRQQDILRDVLPSLRAGGTLIYATCSYAPEENEQVVEALLAAGELVLAPLPSPQQKDLEHLGITPITIDNTPHAAYRCYPHRLQGEGMFFCRLKKVGEETPLDISEAVSSELPKVARDFTNTYLNGTHPVLLEGNQLYLNLDGYAELKQAKLATPKSLLNLGKLHGKGARQGITPSHEMVLSTLLSDDISSVNLTKQDALRYLQKQDLPRPASTGTTFVDELPEQGWVVARYEGLALGWLKATRGQLNNALPLKWRIRQQL